MSFISFWRSKSKKIKSIIVIAIALPTLTITIFKVYFSVFKADKVHIVLSVNQKGGTNIAGDVIILSTDKKESIINKTPECKVTFKVISASEKVSENSYKVVLQLEIDSFYSISTFMLEVRAPTLTKMTIMPRPTVPAGLLSYRHYLKKGYARADIPNADGIYEITLLSEKSERFFKAHCRISY